MRLPRILLAMLATFALVVGFMPTAHADDAVATYIVELKAGVSAQAVIPTLLGGDAKILDKAISGGIATLTASQAKALESNPNVKSVRQDTQVSTSATGTVKAKASTGTVSASAIQTNAPWDLDILDSANATLDGSYTAANDGNGVTVYVVDTGIYRSHSQFANVTVAAGYNFVTTDNPVRPASDSSDCDGQGTAVASLIAGSTLGASKGVTIVPLRVLDCYGSGYVSDLIAALDYIIKNHTAGTPAVVDIGLGTAAMVELDTAVQNVINAGITVVVAADFKNADACLSSPGKVPGAITVAASTSLNVEAAGTSYGSCIDLYAPGEDVSIADITATATGSGTAYSAGLVAAIAAQVLHANPAWTPAQVTADLTQQALDGVVIGLGGLPARSANKLLHVTGTFVGTDPTITGSTFVGETLQASLHWTPTPTTVTYQWNRNGVPIVDASGATYVTTADDLGQSLTVTAVGTGVGYYDVTGTSAAVVPTAAPHPGMVVSLTPSRLLDTRSGTGPLRNGQTVTLPVAGVAGIASKPSAVLVNITVTDATSDGFVTAYASGGAMPATSNGNFQIGKVSATLALVPVGADGAIALSVRLAGTVQLVVDVQSYIPGGAVTEAGAVVPVTPTRLWDTRDPGNAAVGAGKTLDVKVTDVAGVPADATAVFVNVTVTEPQASGYLTVFPSGEAVPATSNLNFVKGLTVPNLALVKVGSGGSISIQNGSPGTAQVVVDIQGYVMAGTPTAAGAVVPVSPTRIVDTRIGLGAKGPVQARTGVVVTVTGDSVPTGTQGVFMNFTVTEPQAPGWLAAYPTQATLPLVSNLNFVGGQTVPNLATVGLTNAQATLFNGSWGSVQMVADVFAYIL